MSKCPECKKEIDHLIHKETVIQNWKTYLDSDGNVDYKEVAEETTTDTDGYFCPECDVRITENSEEQLTEFLDGGRKHGK